MNLLSSQLINIIYNILNISSQPLGFILYKVTFFNSICIRGTSKSLGLFSREGEMSEPPLLLPIDTSFYIHSLLACLRMIACLLCVLIFNVSKSRHCGFYKDNLLILSYGPSSKSISILMVRQGSLIERRCLVL